MEVAWAGNFYNRPDEVVSYLSPRIAIDASQFQQVFNQQLLADKHTLEQSAELAKPESNQIPERNIRFIMNILKEWMDSQELADLGAALFAFGSARFRPEHPFFKEAVQFAKRAALNSFAIITGGGPGIMMAANSGAFGISKSVGLSIKLPSEEKSNPNLDIELIFNYFFIRKLVFILYSRGGAVFPGGYGTLEEIFEVLAFNRRNSHAKRPMVLVNKDFYGGFMKVLDNWAKAGIIEKPSEEIFTLRHTEKEAFEHLAQLWTDKPQREKVNIANFVNALFRASRRLYRIEPSVAIIGGERIKPESEFGKMAFDLATYFSNKGISVIRRGNEGISESIARAYQMQEESQQGRGLYICLDEGEPKVDNHKADKTIYFQYNSALKVAMLKHSMSFIVFPGDIDTLDMLFEILCLIQTRKVKPVPIVLVGKKWHELFDWIEKEMVPNKTIKKEDLSLFKIVNTKEEAQGIILKAYHDIKADYPSKIKPKISPFNQEQLEAIHLFSRDVEQNIDKFRKEYKFDIVGQVQSRLSEHSGYNSFLKTFAKTYGKSLDEEMLIRQAIIALIVGRFVGDKQMAIWDEEAETWQQMSIPDFVSFIIKDELWLFEGYIKNRMRTHFKNHTELLDNFEKSRTKQGEFLKQTRKLLTQVPDTKGKLWKLVKFLDIEVEQRVRKIDTTANAREYLEIEISAIREYIIRSGYPYLDLTQLRQLYDKYKNMNEFGGTGAFAAINSFYVFLKVVSFIAHKYDVAFPPFSEHTYQSSFLSYIKSLNNLNERIIMLKEASGLTNRQIAKGVGCSVSTVNKWTSYESEPRDKHLPYLAKTFSKHLGPELTPSIIKYGLPLEEILMSAFAENLYLLRVLSGLSQEALAKRLKVIATTVEDWERGITVPRNDKIYKKLVDIFSRQLRNKIDVALLMHGKTLDEFLTSSAACADKIKILRLSNGWTVHELAKRMGYTEPVMVYLWEGGSLPQEDKLVELVTQLKGVKENLEATHLLYGKSLPNLLSQKESLAERITLVRLSLGLKPPAMAKLLKIKPQRLRNAEANKEILPPDVLIRFIDIYHGFTGQYFDGCLLVYGKRLETLLSKPATNKKHDIIKYSRIAAGLSKKDLAQKLGMDWNTIITWKNGIHKPHKVNLLRLVEIFEEVFSKRKINTVNDIRSYFERIFLVSLDNISASPIDESDVYPIPYWKNLNEILLTIDNELGLKQDEIGNLYAACDVWAEKAQERLGVLDFIEFAEVLQVGFHWFLIVKFKNDEQLYAFDRTIGQFLTQTEGILKQQIVMMNNFVELDDIKDFVEANQNGFYGKAIEHPLARYIFNDGYTQRDDDLSYLAPLLKRYQFYIQHGLDAVSEKEEIITAITRILQYNNISLSKDRKLSFYFVSNDTGQTLTFDAFKNPRQFKSGGKVYVFGQDKIPAALGKTIENMKESFKQTVLPPQGVVLSMKREQSYAFEKLTDFPEELMDSVFLSSEEIIGKISPYLKQVFEILKEYKSRRIITRYYFTGSFLKGILQKTKDADIDIAVVFRRYHDPDIIRGLLEQIQEISSGASCKIHITLEAFGYEYEIVEDKLIHTGLIRAEPLLARLSNMGQKSLLRLDNLEIPFFPEEFFLKLLRMCREFNFTENNLKLIEGKDVKNNSNNNGIYEEDLMSNDPEVRLKAAIVLKQKGCDNPKLAEVFRNSAVNKNLTLDERLKAAEYLSDAEKEKLSFELRPDKEQAARIDKGENDDFEELAHEAISEGEAVGIIKGVSGMNEQMAENIISRIQQVSWHGQEFEKTMQGIKYFNGYWKEQLKNRLYSEYDIHLEMIDMLIERDVPTRIIFSPVEYLFAALIAQEIIHSLREDNVIILEGDRDWFLLESFQLVQKNMGDLSFNAVEKNKHTLESKWQGSTAISRTIDIFKSLKNLGLYTRRYNSDVETEAMLGSASQFIARAYNDSAQAEFAPGPCYDTRGVSVGIESNRSQNHDSIHINHGVKWASKYIWAAYLVMYNYITDETFNRGRFDYYYNQLVKEENQFNGIDRRTSYIGVWVKDIKDLDMILEIFIPFSIALTNYMENDNVRLTKIFREFRLGMEDIIRNQYDHKLNQEFFEQARMVRFVELISRDNRDNDFYRALKKLVEDTQKKIDEELLSLTLDTHSSKPLIPLSRNLQTLPTYQLVGASI